MELDARGPALCDGSIIQFGWSRLVLKGELDELRVCEPDFDCPGDVLPYVDETLRIAVAQAAVLGRVGTQGVDARFDTRLIAAKGALDEDRIYLERSEPTSEEDSGWYIGPADGPKRELAADDLEQLYVSQLVSLRRDVLSVLALPPGYLVVFDGELIDGICPPGGEDVWSEHWSADVWSTE